jgi:pimeloyl-ACP methyl ester carboxylesterase
MLDWADDVAALADELSWGRFSVAGVSGGGPHALACAVALPERIAAVGVVSSVAPFWPGALEGMLPTTRRAFQLARWAQWLLVFEARRLGRHPDRFLHQVRGQLPECDRRVVDRPEVADVMAADAAEALAGDEVAREMRLLRRARGVSPRATSRSPCCSGTGSPTATFRSRTAAAWPPPARLPPDVRTRGRPLPHLRSLGGAPVRCRRRVVALRSDRDRPAGRGDWFVREPTGAPAISRSADIVRAGTRRDEVLRQRHVHTPPIPSQHRRS